MGMSSDDVTKAMILATGEGTNLRPLTLETPKVLLPLGGVPLICYTLSWLRKHGVREVTINLHHLGEKIRAFLDDGTRFGVRIHYSYEEALLGTAGGVKRAERFLADTFVVVYGDVLTDFDLSEMVRFHRARKALATLALVEVANPRETGIVRLGEKNRVVSFVEKPSGGAEAGDAANGGVYVLNRKVLQFIPSEGYCDFAYDIFPKLVGAGHHVYGYCLKPEDYLIDVGNMDRYRKANQDVMAGKVKLTYGQQSGVSG